MPHSTTESKPNTLGVGFRSIYFFKFSWWFKCVANFDNSYSEPFVHSITQQVYIDYQIYLGTILSTGDLKKKKRLEDYHQRSQLMFRQSVGPGSYRTLKNFGFYSRCNGRPWMGWEGRGLSTEVTWSDLYFSKIPLATPLENIIKMRRFEDKTNHEFSRTQQQKLLDTCFYYCLCLRPTEWYTCCFRVIIPLGHVYMNYSDTSPFNKLPVFREDYA